MKRIILLFVLVFGVTLGINAEKSASIFQRYQNVRNGYNEHYYGYIGDYKIEVYLKHYNYSGPEGNRSWKVVGKYRYIRGGKPGNWLGLTGSGAHLGGYPTVVELNEYNASGTMTGKWELNNGCFFGDFPPSTFTNPKNGNVLYITLNGSDYN